MEAFYYLKRMLITLQLPELFRNIPQLRDSNSVSLINPFLNNISGTSFWKPKPKNPALQIIPIFLRIQLLF